MLAEEEQDACIAAGAKLRSRSRLYQSGPLTGQQYWVRKDSAHAKVNVKPTKAKTTAQVLKPQRVARSTSGTHRSLTGVSPGLHRLGALRARKGRGGSGLVGRRLKKPAPPSHMLRNRKVAGSAWRRHRRGAMVPGLS
jgi:hypothetical protein